MENENIISKGFYRFPQVRGFIAVKNHMFIRGEDKVYLALRFSNDTEYTFNFFSFDIIELNAEGKQIGKVFVEYKNISFAPGTIFAPDKGFAVSSGCVDFRIEFREAFSGAYKYTVRRGKVAVSYGKKEAAIHTDNVQNRSNAGVRVKQRKTGKPFLAAFLVFLTLVIMAFCIGRSLYKDFEKEKGDVVLQYIDICEEAGVTYAEI